MHITHIYEAKTHLSQFLEPGQRGEEVIIGKAGKRWYPMIREMNRDEADSGGAG